jgi:hypothetical protein
MSWTPNDKEIESVIRLPASERYKYFVKKAADAEQVWSLRKDAGWATSVDDAGLICVPVWPHAKYAAACANESWAGFEPHRIELEAWLERWLPGMQRDGRLAAVFPTPTNQAVSVPPDRLKRDLEAELELYE